MILQIRIIPEINRLSVFKQYVPNEIIGPADSLELDCSLPVKCDSDSITDVKNISDMVMTVRLYNHRKFYDIRTLMCT